VSVARPRAYFSNTRFRVGSNAFLRWWYTAQWQVLFNRFPQLEEALRLIPGLYSTWLRLWGARIGGLVYWSPGLTIFDRPFLHIGDRVVIGADTKLSPHFLARGESGNTELVLAPITIEHDAMIGGSTLLPAGVYVAACEQTPGGRPLAPFSRFENGRHVRTQRFTKDAEYES
jgi:acetyltransferase-like isoleucine patch superfamily enzyme